MTRSTFSAPPPALHALWQPRLGLAVWPRETAGSGDDSGTAPRLGDLTSIPAPVADLLADRRCRHRISRHTVDGRREIVRAAVLGIAGTIALLDRSREITLPGELRFYRAVLAAVRATVTAGAVAPSLVITDGEPELRWLPVPTPAWRSLLTVLNGSAPPAVLDNGGTEAVADLAGEFTDAECRSRLNGDGGHAAPSAPLLAALADPDRPLPSSLSAERAAPATDAWATWLGSAAGDRPELLLRLHQPDDPGPPDEDFGDDRPADPGPDRWRLEVCRRGSDGTVTPVVAHRLEPAELDAVTTDLAEAVRAFGVLAHAEADPLSLDYLLTTDEAAELFADGGAALAAAGITLLLPRGVATVNPALQLAARAPDGGAANRPALVGADELTEFHWQIALGDAAGAAALSQADLDELARQHGDLVRLRGEWVRAEGAALSRAAAFLAAQSRLPGTTSNADLIALVADPADRLPLPVATVTGADWLDEVVRSGVIRPPEVTEPEGLAATLRPYQLRGLAWLSHLAELGVGGVLADDMGLGKTVQVIALLVADAERAGPRPPSLVVCPMSVIGNWHRELSRFAPGLTVLVHHGPRRDATVLTDLALSDTDASVVITTFATLHRDRTAFAGVDWHRLIVDEAQHVKNVNTAAARALRALSVRHRIALTGTPVENRIEDLRAVIDLVNPGLLGSASQFRSRFAEPIERDRDPVAVARLTALTRPFILRREKSDPAIAPDLPDKTELVVRANLTTEQAGLYQAVLDELREALEDRQQGAVRRRTVLAALTRLKQVCNHPAHYLDDGSGMLRNRRHRSGKVELICDLVGTLVAEGDRALIFSQYAVFGELLAGWLGELLDTEVPMLHGGLPRAERDRLVTGFAEPDGPPVLVATLKAGGTGLNLTAANQVIHADRWWNPAVEDQATDRAYRIGQQRAVQVRKIVCVGTLEERIDELIDAKRELSRLTVAAGENWLTELGDAELFDLLELRDEAVGE